MENENTVILQKPLRPIRSFVRRESPMTKAKKIAWDSLWPIHGLMMDDKEVLDLDALFGRKAPKVLEIGFGDGQSLLKMAMAMPEKDFIGVEVYKTGVINLLLGIAQHKLSNIRIFCQDALEVLECKIPNGSLETLQVFFADPWPKTRHHKRRLVQSTFIALAAQKLQMGGKLHLATDWMSYADHMMSVLSADKAFRNKAGFREFMPRPICRPLTKYEQRGLRLGHETRDLIFERIAYNLN